MDKNKRDDGVMDSRSDRTMDKDRRGSGNVNRDDNSWEAKWDQFKGSIKQKWGDLTDNDVKEVEGRRDKMIGKLKEKYGMSDEEAERQVKDFENENWKK